MERKQFWIEGSGIGYATYILVLFGLLAALRPEETLDWLAGDFETEEEQ